MREAGSLLRPPATATVFKSLFPSSAPSLYEVKSGGRISTQLGPSWPVPTAHILLFRKAGPEGTRKVLDEPIPGGAR
jgi:hypothetical protein